MDKKIKSEFGKVKRTVESAEKNLLKKDKQLDRERERLRKQVKEY